MLATFFDSTRLPRTLRRLALASFCAASLWLLPLESRAADDPAETLQSVSVLQAVLNVHVTTEYAQFGNSPAYATRMTIESVKTPSAAQRAGLKPGMEIVAIQGRHIAGLTRGEVENLMDQPVKDALVILVKKGWFKKAEEVTLPLPKVKPDDAPAQSEPVPVPVP